MKTVLAIGPVLGMAIVKNVRLTTVPAEIKPAVKN